MADLGLKTFNKLYPMMIRKYQDLIVDQNATEKDKINQIIQKLNALGKLSNDVVRDWNTVYQWAMNDGLATDVNNKIEAMKTSGDINTLLNNIFVSLTGDMSTLLTTAKDTTVNAINEVDGLAKQLQTNQGDLTQLQTTDKDSLVHAINDNVVSLMQIAYQIPLTATTSDIQTAFNSHSKVLFLDGTYNISSPLFLNSNQEIFVSPNTVLQALPTTFTTETDCLLTASNKSNIKIHGHLKIVMNKSEYTTGEHRHCLSLLSVKNFYAETIECISSGGDGVYFGSIDNISFNENINVETIIVDNNRRNGISIISGKKIRIGNIIATNTKGTAPEYGVDIEPNANTNILQDIIIDNLYSEANNQGALCFAIGQLKDSTSSTSVTVKNIYSFNDGISGVLKFMYNNWNADTNQLSGTILVENVLIENPRGRGVDFTNYTSKCVKVRLNNCKVINAGSDLTLTNSQDLSGFFCQTYSTDTATKVGNFELINCSAIDNRATPRMVLPFYLPSSYKLFEKVLIQNPYGENQTSTTNGIMNLGKGDIKVVIDNPLSSPFSVTSVVTTYRAMELTNSTSSNIALTLPLASDYPNAIYLFKITNGLILVTPQATDKFYKNGASVGQALVGRKIGAYLIVKSNGVDGWEIQREIGYWNLSGYSGESVTVWAGQAPTTGAWVVADTCINTNPSETGTAGSKYIIDRWRCTSAGTPGTWTPCRYLTGN